MESWSYISEGRGYFVSEEIGFPSDAHARSRTSLAGWEAKGPLNIENNASAFNYQESEGAECSELGFLEIMSKLFPSDSCVKLLDGETGADSSTRIDSATCLNTSTSSLGEDKIGSRLSSFLLEFNSQEPSLIDLKLGSLADSGDTKKRKAFRKRSLLPQIASTMSVKGTGSTNLCSQTFMCQVHGCNKDLSASKDYHKRHKVCDAHSKSTKVIVDGIEQRFCQQCSRFHLLAEFDDGKRSCRKRLAGHNERRRKPQLNVYSLKEDKLLRSYQGTTGLFGTLAEKISSFVFPNMSADRVFCSDESADFPKRIKFEEAAFCSSQHVTSLRNAHLPPKCSNQYEGTQCPVWIPPPVNEDFISMTSAIPESSPPLTSGNALSLLSAQSRALSVDSAGIPVATTSALHDLRYAGSLSSDSRFCANPSKDTAPNEFSSFRGNLMESGSAVAFGVGLEEACQGSDSNVSGRCSPNNGPHTVGLLKLSSHLQRVEQQRHLLQVKREIGESCRPPVLQLQ